MPNSCRPRCTSAAIIGEPLSVIKARGKFLFCKAWQRPCTKAARTEIDFSNLTRKDGNGYFFYVLKKKPVEAALVMLRGRCYERLPFVNLKGEPRDRTQFPFCH